MDSPPFEEAVARFRSFLDEHGHLGEIWWVFSTDALLVRGKWFIRPRPQTEVIEEVVATYRKAVARRLGVKFGVLGREGNNHWCFIFAPSDQIDAEYCLMPDGLKLSVLDPLLEARSVTDEWEWDNLQSQDQVDFKHSYFK